jgi:hypothetical protein
MYYVLLSVAEPERTGKRGHVHAHMGREGRTRESEADRERESRRQEGIA